MYIYSHNRYSHGANQIRRELGLRSLHRAIERGRRLPQNLQVINWGSSTIADLRGRGVGFVNYRNHPVHVAVAAHKLRTFQKLKEAGVSIPEFTTDWNTAHSWWWNDRIDVVCRTKLQSSGGDGIFIYGPGRVDEGDEFDPNREGRLYVKYIKKKHEYRVHVANHRAVGGYDDTGYQVICLQQKRKVRGAEADSQIRSHDRGWVFVVNDVIQPNHAVIAESVAAVRALGLDFGAVDVIWNERQQRAYVLEVNTAPGLEEDGTALRAYCEYFRRFM